MTKEEKAYTLPVDTAVRNIKDFYENTVKDPHGRNHSWEHCYKVFCENRGALDEWTIDYLSLHLAFYLASWGMYRGSAFLFQKDYKVHAAVVKLLQKKEYQPLIGISAEELTKEENLKLLDDISGSIREIYAQELPVSEKRKNQASDILITKILLGTLGCVPAYDRYYIQAVKTYHISSGTYNSRSVKEVAEYYLNNKQAFEEIRGSIRQNGQDYPPMKLIDMCMWQTAYQDEQQAR